ncbi:hypothetical protein [Actinoplanes subtropicus]|uniref:hypothetical protein n=1 Tax=Actinoplanes subtropicus TaxID=543632 RepID=UPI0004C478C3|nr:hypothetical protein [Actinoplanes subtropicus]
MRNIIWQVSGYVAVSLVTVGVMVAFRHDTAMVTPGVWIRGSIVAAASLLTLLFAVRAVRGDRKMLLRLRLVTAIMLVALVVIASLPGAFPVWFRLEQALCALFLLPVAVQINRRSVTQA